MLFLNTPPTAGLIGSREANLTFIGTLWEKPLRLKLLTESSQNSFLRFRV